MSLDRFSVHIDNGQAQEREAVTIMRNGGTASQSGLVGITNATYPGGGDPIIPETILNVQSTGDCNVRFSSGPSKFYRSSLELLGNGNKRASGLHISYDPEFDDSFINDGSYGGGYDGSYSESCVNPNGLDRTVADFSLIRPSGCEGMEFSHISITELGYVGIGLTRTHKTRHFHANSPLTIAYMCDGVADSGTVAMHEQGSKPAATADFGKIYVKPFITGGRSQALFFLDDIGVETNLVLSQDLDPTIASGGLIYGNNGNTYGGWFTPALRTPDATKSNNTYYGWGAGYNLSNNGTATCNTLVGRHSGSGLLPSSSNNTIIGCDSLAGYTGGNRNIIIGDGNATNGGGFFGGMDDSILIGRRLYQSSLPPDGTFALGFNDKPVMLGGLLGNDRFISVVDAEFSLVQGSDSEFKTTFEFDNQPHTGGPSRYATVIDTIDLTEGGSNHGRNNLRFQFSNSTGLAQRFFTLDPVGGPLTNTPNYNIPLNTPFAELDADFKLRGAIRFQDGTAMSGLSEFNMIPLNGTSGTNVLTENNENYVILDFSELDLVGNITQEGIRTDNTYLAAQVDGGDSTLVGRMSIAGLAVYLSSGASSLTENCNILISNPENEINVNASSMSRSVMIGCDVAYGASGWKNSVLIGAEAGANATVNNPSLDIDTAVVFIGHRAGYDCDNVDNTIGIGTNAAKDSDSASDSIFIGSNAGLEASFSNSIGIGEHALRGLTNSAEAGTGNLEIVCGIDDNNRLMYNGGTLSNRINIMNVMAGRNDIPNMSIGVPRLSPTAPLEVRRDSVAHGGNSNDYIQAWYCDNQLVAYIDCDGILSAGGIQSTSGPIDRPSSDTTSVTFSWPVSGATITSEVSIDNAAYVATVGVVTFLRTEGSLHYYALSFNASDRPAADGTARYKFTDGTFTQYLTLRFGDGTDSVGGGTGSAGGGSDTIEGVLDTSLAGFVGSMGAPNTAVMSVYEDGVNTGRKATVYNRDNSLGANAGTYIIAMKLNGQYRPIWVGC
jgi:hypothetical protein